MAEVDSRANPYLVGAFAPVRDELTSTDLCVQGAIPRELSGRLLRNGPNPVGSPDPATYHWFTGDGMLHAVELDGGRAVSYRNRWVRTDSVCAALGEQPPAGQPTDVFPLGTSSAANTHVICHAGRVLALEEAHLPTRVTPDLATVGRYDFGGRLRSAMTAHPKLDPATGELVFFGYNVFGPPYVRYHVADTSGELVRTEPISFRGPAMVHDFAITERYVVWMDLPVVFDLGLAEQGLFPFSWQPSYGSRVGVMPRAGGDPEVRWFDIGNCYVYHPLNAYDDGEAVVVDVARHPDMFTHDRHGPGGGDPTLDRWRIDLATGKVVEERLDDRGQEFPRVDDRLVGRRHRYGYTAQTGLGGGVRLGGLLKHDLVAGTVDTWQPGPGRCSSEAVFVPSSPDAGEDEGWLLATVYDGQRDGSDLVLLDATAIMAGPVATIRLPQRVPMGFHGSWIPADAA